MQRPLIRHKFYRCIEGGGGGKQGVRQNFPSQNFTGDELWALNRCLTLYYNNNNNNNNNRKPYQETFDRFTTKDSYTWNITHDTESTAV